MTIEALYKRIIASDELKSAFVEAVKAQKLGDFLKSQGCEATGAEAIDFLKSLRKGEGELADDELSAVARRLQLNRGDIFYDRRILHRICNHERGRSGIREQGRLGRQAALRHMSPGQSRSRHDLRIAANTGDHRKCAI